MVKGITYNNSHPITKHQANMAASLSHRLEVAREMHDTQLLELLEQERQQLTSAATSKQAVPEFIAGLKNLWQGLIEAIACSSELQVWQTWSSSGIGWWHAYDPMTGQSVCTDSELELRLWIEQNYRGS